jgi:glycosyltransferase involved in cell wall biosynthesis
MKTEVSIFMVTYNHKNYIRKAIESVLAQKTNFPFVLVIGDDASTDGTSQIVREFEEKFPAKIKALISKDNLGPMLNSKKVLEHCDGKYIAMLEGDDYWTDISKLQKQYDFLEENKKFSLCFHDINIIDRNDEIISSNSANIHRYYNKRDISKEELLFGPFVLNTCTMFFMNIKVPEWYVDFLTGDKVFQRLLSFHGNGYFLDENMANYRKHSSSLTKSKMWPKDIDYESNEIKLFQNLSSLAPNEEISNYIKANIRFLDLKRSVKQRKSLFSKISLIFNLRRGIKETFIIINPFKPVLPIYKYIIGYDWLSRRIEWHVGRFFFRKKN